MILLIIIALTLIYFVYRARGKQWAEGLCGAPMLPMTSINRFKWPYSAVRSLSPSLTHATVPDAVPVE